MVRFETYRAGAFLVWQLRHAGITIQEDGADIIQARLPTGEIMSIHLIETSIPAYEIKSIMAYNEANGMHTLFLLWAEMLLPPEDHVIVPHDWEEVLISLYGDRIYAYEVFGQEIFVFTVYFDHYNRYRHIRYGETLNMAMLAGVFVETNFPLIKGRWRVASFNRLYEPHADTEGAKEHHARPIRVQLNRFYAVLGVQANAEPEAVKTAYRNLARKLHPDYNKSPDATEKMQALNEAYRHIMETFETDDE